MRVANKLTPETKSKMTETKPGHRPEQFQDTSSYLFQIARGSGATLEIPKNTKIYI